MTVSQLAEQMQLQVLSMPAPEREVTDGYVGDLLSWVMGRAQEDMAWITIMSNVNIVAVAALVNVSCILLAEGVVPDAAVTDTARQKGINLLVSSRPAYATAVLLSKAIGT